MEKYCKKCGRVFDDLNFKLCPYCGSELDTRYGRQPIPRKLRHEVFKRDGYRCRECGATNKQTRLHVDHIKPVAKGGTNDLSNLQTLCEACNRAKYTDEWVGGSKNVNENTKINIKVKPKELEGPYEPFTRISLEKEINYVNLPLDIKMKKVLHSYKHTLSLESAAELNGIPGYEPINWYNQGRLDNGLFINFYNQVNKIKKPIFRSSKINDDVAKKCFANVKLSKKTINKLHMVLNGLSNGYGLHSFDKYGINKIKIQSWYLNGKRGDSNFIEFYNEVNKIRPDIAKKFD